MLSWCFFTHLSLQTSSTTLRRFKMTMDLAVKTRCDAPFRHPSSAERNNSQRKTWFLYEFLYCFLRFYTGFYMEQLNSYVEFWHYKRLVFANGTLQGLTPKSHRVLLGIQATSCDTWFVTSALHSRRPRLPDESFAM